MSDPGTVIIGAGQGGLQAALSLRQDGYAAPVTLIGAEPGLPYQRPPLSKTYLADGNGAALVLRPESVLAAKGITYLPGTRALGIDRAARQVVLPHGRLDYDRLILATGTRTLRPPIAGLDRAFELRSLADAARLRAALDRPRRVAVIGGGFIGLEFAAAARKLGHRVAVIEVADRLLARVVSVPMSRHVERLHRDWGTEIHLGQPAVVVDDTGVTLADGSHVAAGMVLLAAGVCPNTELAEAAGLAVENGIRTDARLQTDDPAIFALGDCASFPDPRTGRRVRLESVQAATDHARLIAARIARGNDAPYAALPWFWSDQGACKLQIAGLAGPDATDEPLADGVIARLDAMGVAALETMNDAGAHMRARRLLAGHAPVTLDDLRAAISKAAA